jgi:hypothetical protein
MSALPLDAIKIGSRFRQDHGDIDALARSIADIGLLHPIVAGRYRGGRVAEIFLSAERAGTPLEAIARDAAILASLAFQHGVALETIRAALTRDHDGGPATAIGAAVDKLAEGGAA